MDLFHRPQIGFVNVNEIIIWPGVCGKGRQLYAHHTVKVFVQFAYPRVHVCVSVCVYVCVRVCVCECVCVLHTCLEHAVLFRALQLQFLSLYITFFLSFCVFFFPPLSVLLFLFSSLYLSAVLLALVPMPRPPLWHHVWLGPIRSAAGEGGEWDAGSSESGPGSHHTVLRPWNVSGTTTTTTTTTTANRAASLSPFSLLSENSHTETSLHLPGANSPRNLKTWNHHWSQIR